jgi:putative sigma-54 modulation protein
MKLQIQSIHFTADVKLIDLIQKKLDKLETFYDKIVGGEVFLKLENDDQKENKVVQVKLQIKGYDLIVKEQFSSFEEGIDAAYENLKRQLLKTKEKMQAH